MHDLISDAFFSILAAGFFVGVVVGLTGMGGGALMTPALIFLGVGDAATVVTADLTAAGSRAAAARLARSSPTGESADVPCPTRATRTTRPSTAASRATWCSSRASVTGTNVAPACCSRAWAGVR